MALIHYITQIQFEFGAIGLLRQQCERVGIRRPLIVTDRGVKAAGIIDTVLDALAHAGTVALYDGTPPNPNEAAVREAVGAYRKGDCDGIVAVGGGSAIDLAKGVAVCATHDGPLQSFALIEGGADRITSRTAPVIAVPTTAGTGSEVTPWATVWDEREPRKHSIDHPALFPEAALDDPELTLTLPEEPTVTAALDALSHAMEAVWNRNANPVSDVFAVRAITVIPDALRNALGAPTEIHPREMLQLASLFAGLAFSNTRTALAHSLSYPLTASLGLPHGLACSFTLPEVLMLNAKTDPHRVGIVCDALGAGAPQEGANRLYSLFSAVNLPAHLIRHVPDTHTLESARGTFITPGRATNNLASATDDLARDIVRAAYDTVCAGPGDPTRPSEARGDAARGHRGSASEAGTSAS
jgi:4-hydroxybutyrate dehydrogenase